MNVIIISDIGTLKNINKSARNIKNLKIINDAGANIYDMLKYKNVLLTQSSVKSLEKRILNEKINYLDSIIRPIVTEKATILSEQNKTVFKVHKKANKNKYQKKYRKIIQS